MSLSLAAEGCFHPLYFERTEGSRKGAGTRFKIIREIFRMTLAIIFTYDDILPLLNV
jgi:hypothetical protein